MPFYIFLWLRTLKKYIHQCLPANSINFSLVRVNPYFCPAKDFHTMASTFMFLVLTLATTLVSTGETLRRKPLVVSPWPVHLICIGIQRPPRTLPAWRACSLPSMGCCQQHPGRLSSLQPILDELVVNLHVKEAINGRATVELDVHLQVIKRSVPDEPGTGNLDMGTATLEGVGRVGVL